ncbi:MAG: Acyl-CoA dehydrogenase C-terminal domain-containing protein, partial [Planctomycetia bacterium]|nr:Acyl-CoA dehydrogenase C-terminal domain-containing protein [Planctomycetia bacterium]
GTSQLQVVAAIKGLTSGVYQSDIETFEAKEYEAAELTTLRDQLKESRKELDEAITFARAQGGIYLDLHAREVVDAGIAILVGHYLLGQATRCDRKKRVVKYFIEKNAPVITRNCRWILSGNTQAVDDYALFVK